MKKLLSAVILGISFMLYSVSQAAVAYRVVSEIQSSVATSDSAPRLVYVSQAGQWVGPVDCPLEWSYFDARFNAQFLAILLTADAASRVIRVYVDDSLPKANGWCQVSHLSLLPGS